MSEWIEGRPPVSTEAAWLVLVGEEGQSSVVLGVRDETGAWTVAADWQGAYCYEDIVDPITHWTPYRIPEPPVL